MLQGLDSRFLPFSTSCFKQKQRSALRIPRDSPCINFLTKILLGPALAVLAFAFGKTRTTLRASNPDAMPSSWHRSTLRKNSPSVKEGKFFGERGIRTLDTRNTSYDGLANRCLQPLGHLSNKLKS